MTVTAKPEVQDRRFARTIRVLDLIWIGCVSFVGAYFVVDFLIWIVP